MSIQSEVNKWLASPEGKKRVAEAQRKAMLEGRPFGRVKGGSPIDRKLVAQYAEEMITSILHNLPDSLRYSSVDPITRASFNEPVIRVVGDKFHVSITFRKDAVHRESLMPDYWDGVENIVVHLSNGWSARGSVQGTWNGGEYWSRMEYAGDSFMADAVAEFNSSHELADATLGPDYSV